MALRRHRHHTDATRYKMREDLLSIGDDYWIEDEGERRAFRVNGKALRVRDTWVLEDHDGHEVAKIRERKLSVRDAITIETDDCQAKVKKALVGIRDRFHVEVDHGDDLRVHGNVVDHEYEVERDGTTVAQISKKWFRVRDTYGIEVRDPAATALLLAVTVAVDALAHDRG